MPIVRCEPFRGLVSSQKDFDRFFREGDLSTRTWAPPVDIYEDSNNLVLKADLPGVDPKDVEIKVENGTLYLSGERKFEKEVREESYHRVERSYGAFSRSFSLPNSIDSDKVVAEYKDGQLILTMPKREESKPKTIKVNVSKN